MSETNNLFKKINNISKYNFKDGEEVIEINNIKYIVKEKLGNKKELYEYLCSRNFHNYLDLYSNDLYEIYPYEKDNINMSDKSIDLVYILSMLHIKTTTYQEINLDRIKEVYESFNIELNNIMKYYYNLQDFIESKIYMSPAQYLLIRNISDIYKMLNESKKNIDKWYNIKIKQKKERVALVHNNISLNNFIDNENKVLKNWDYSHKDWVVYDFYNFYRNDYKDLEFSSLYEIYQNKYKFNEEEILLFKALIFKIWKVELNRSNYDNCIKVNDLIIYIEKTNNFLLKNDQEEKKTNKDKLEEQNYNIKSSSNK